MTVQPTVCELGTQFYIQRYIIGYPQEPPTAADFHTAPWFSSTVTSDIMAAVGLSALANLNGSKVMWTTARQKYALALRNTHKLIGNPDQLDPPSVLRSVVLLAMFEVVSGTSEQDESIRTHILGAAALLNAFRPKMTDQVKALRGVVQLCFTMLVPCYLAGVNLPATALDWLSGSAQSLPPDQKVAADLVIIIAQFIQLSIRLKDPTIRPREMKSILSETLAIETALGAREEPYRQPGSIWAFTTQTGPFPPQAALGGRYHIYAGGLWTALVWNYYRWARILVNETILDLAGRFPNYITIDSSYHLEVIRRQAEDVLVSLPTHYRHPALARGQRALLDRAFPVVLGQGGGSSGVPILMVQLRIAACAPGVPKEYAQWTLDVFETIWRETGILQAKSLASVMREHIDKSPAVEEVKVERAHD
jgi:hypothetical protein